MRLSRFRRRVAAFRSSLQRRTGLSAQKSRHTAYPAPATHKDITDSGAGCPASTSAVTSTSLPGHGEGNFQRRE
ncbi:hypothetical protein R9D88_005127 [Escherichia coli]|uniref:Uncharacterized protein n=1 Tax=Escherichia coli TaxID=562 RepID=T2HU85_ECOLX|nr:hypothetical protein [Escherichia coli]BAN82843.1 hypothetical protein [Escherichia coli]